MLSIESGMSSQSGASPPQSAQPYTSIFGGSSSHNIPESEPPSQTQEGPVVTEYDSDDQMDDRPLWPDDLSDNDLSYVPSDAEDTRAPMTQDNDFPGHTVVPVTSNKGKESAPSSIEYRANRFHGPDSTWRKLTVEDRENAMALEEIRARDLAAHLYNAYALRVRAREAARHTDWKRGRSKKPELFSPPLNWTGWPVPVEEVPRADERVSRFEDHMWTLRAQPDSRYSAELEECMIASMLKVAKERFQAREWDYQGITHQRWPSQRNSDDHGSEGDEDPPDQFLLPVVQADDDKSRQQLRPLSRNIISQFEQLLLGLHRSSGTGRDKNRKNTGDWETGSGESETDAQSMYSRSPSASSRKRRLSGYEHRSQSRGRKRMRTLEWETRSSRTRTRSMKGLGEAHSNVTSRSRGRPRGRSHGQATQTGVNIRDWSEVVGIASLIGWPHEVVMRTAQRCASIFGEDMAFRIFKDSQEEEEEESNSGPEQLAPPSKSPSQSRRPRSRATSTKTRSASRATAPVSERSDGSRPPKGKGAHRKKDLVCPVKTCSRHLEGFSRTWNLNQHIKTKHPSYRPRNRSTNSHATSAPGSETNLD